MMRKYLILALIYILAGCSSQRLPESNAEYAVSTLSLLKSDHSVVQEYNADLEINSTENATFHIRKVTTVLNSDARDAGKLILPYGGFQDINYVDGALYSGDGKLIRRLEENDGMDFSLSSGGYSLYEDTRIKTFALYHNEYPYTVVYDYEIEYNGLLNLPTFHPQNQNQYVEHASLKVTVPNDIILKHRSFNTDSSLSKHVVGQDSVYIWNLKELKPLEKQPYGKSFVEVAPRILLATKNFKMADSEGKLDSWNHFGQWYYSLSKGRDVLPESTKQEVKYIFNNAPNKKQGIEALYKYMQNKTRYVSIQLGIGGWQPFRASYVEQKGYGDCKALTNYMKAILNYAGVEAYPVLIRNGTEAPDIITDFPSNQFNHVILWVPEADTVWLESTSQTIPFNYIGYSNSDRYGLAVTPDSSFLLKTPTYDHRTNKLKNDVKLAIDDYGNASINIQTSYSGYYLDKLIGNIAQKSDSERQKWMHEQFTLNSFRIDNANFSDIDERKVAPELHFEIYNPRYATKTGSRLFIPVNKLNQWDKEFPAMSKERTEEVELEYSFEEVDRSVIALPENFELEAMPKSLEINTSFSSYSLQINEESNRVEIVRALKVSERILPSDKYDELREFFMKVRDHDNKSIVLKAR